MARHRAEKAILVLALLGMIVAAYALSLHYAAGPSKICDISATFSCDKVNKSPWATLLGVPVALLGLLGYASVLFLVLKRRAVAAALDFTEKDYWQYLLALLTVMLLFQGYLTFVEIFFVRAYCVVCLVSQATIIALVALAAHRYASSR